MKLKICYVVNTDWSFINFRLPIAIACLKNDYEVHLITEVTSQENLIYLKEQGIEVHDVKFKRDSNNPVHIISLFLSILKLLKTIRPSIVHLVTIKAVLIGGIACRFSKVKKIVAAITGLGSSFIGKSPLSLFRKKLLILLYKILLSFEGLYLIFQNEDDRKVILNFTNKNVPNCLIPGSGVDLSKFKYQEENSNKIPNILMVSRLIKDKGVIEFCEAASKVRKKGIEACFTLIGGIDKGNPSSLREADILNYSNNGIITFKGYSNDVISELENCNLFVLPSYREGFSKAIIEASAIGRAIITTNVPGCRDAIEAGKNGLLIKERDVDSLVEAITFLLNNPSKRLEMGRRSRHIAEQKFSIENVIKKHLEIYKS